MLRNQWELTITAVVVCDMNAPLEAVDAAHLIRVLQNPDAADDTMVAMAYRELVDRKVVCVNRNRRVAGTSAGVLPASVVVAE